MGIGRDDSRGIMLALKRRSDLRRWHRRLDLQQPVNDRNWIEAERHCGGATIRWIDIDLLFALVIQPASTPPKGPIEKRLVGPIEFLIVAHWPPGRRRVQRRRDRDGGGYGGACGRHAE